MIRNLTLEQCERLAFRTLKGHGEPMQSLRSIWEALRAHLAAKSLETASEATRRQAHLELPPAQAGRGPGRPRRQTLLDA